MPEIIAAVDETSANSLIDTAIGAIPPQSASGSSSLGPFVVTYGVSATLVSGDVDLRAPDIIGLRDVRVNFTLNFSFGFDLSTILPDFCLPQVCVRIPCVGRVCTPRICIDWPTIAIPVSFSDFVEADGDFRLLATLNSGVWKVEAQIVGLPSLRFGLATGALLLAIGAAAALVLAPIPFIGPFLAIAVNAILLAIGIAGVTGLLGPILTPFVSGLRIPIHEVPQVFEVLPIEGPVDPRVTVTIDAIAAEVRTSDEDELVITADISA
ncbi:hypothetical protein [Methylibium rhizosphaerae]|uniref:hypothetical protein n=1 Tax=Methylibium rhizosphaerae TaxID=2570323 RepID=UPI0011264B19|nr:hypothetical protein [Methylibium rhizosphaerae]